jgi:multisubunit Na+/H+ antiporter MnhG subunit
MDRMAIPERADTTTVPNGAALAAFLAAGIGAFALGAIVILNEVGLFSAPALYDPAGGVTGRTALGAVTWLIAWVVLHRRWRHQTLRAGGIYALTLLLIALGVLLTFPPLWHLLG